MWIYLRGGITSCASNPIGTVGEGGSAASPVLSGLLLQGSLLVFGLPFILAGTLKVVYDSSLWLLFRNVRLQEEESSQ